MHRVTFTAGLTLLAAALSLPAAAQTAAPVAPAPDGFHSAPALYWKSGEHRIDLGLALRSRWETWDAFSAASDAYTGTRTRLRGQYGFGERFLVVAELQDVRVAGMGDDATGAERLYLNANEGDSRAGGTHLRQAFVELHPTPTSFVRAGRADVKLGQEVMYPEPDWKYLKAARLGERLVGTVGWSHSERAYDGASAGLELGSAKLFAFAARPTTGVFEVERAYRPLHDIWLGGATATVKRGTLAANGELGAFALYYDDDRPLDRGGIAEGIDVTTLGAHWLQVEPLGAGKLDALLWGAFQIGDFGALDHQAWALIAELGYQLPDLFAKPWLRVGLNWASGDPDPTDGDHETFHNLLPTNHLYYGFADQLAFQNLQDWFVQLRLAPHPIVSLNLMLHAYRLSSGDDARYAGTGAFDRRVFGYTAQPSRGHEHIGSELDAVVTLALHKNVGLELGYAFVDGGALFKPNASRDVHFGYAAVELRY